MFAAGTRPSFAWADYVVLGVVLSVSLVIGIFYALWGRRNRTTNEFIVAHRQMGHLPVAMSLLASLFTGIYIQGMVAEVYFRGAMAPFSAVFPLAFSGFISGRIFMPTFYKLRLRSVYQYLDMRFNKTIRNCCLIIGYLYMILHAGVATFAACLVLTTVSNMSFLTANIVLSGVCTFYTALGGIKAVLWADAFQMVLIYSPLVAAVTVAFAKLGVGEVWSIGAEEGRLDIFNFSPDPTEYLTLWTAILGGTFTWMPSMCILQYQVQRYNTCKDEKTANIAFSLFAVGCLVIVVLCGIGGLCVFSMYANCDPFSLDLIRFRDELLPYFVLDAFSHLPGLPGLLVSGLCSAALSTVSSIINSIVTVSGEHIITKVWKTMPDSTYMFITKILAVFFGALNIGMAYLMSSLGDIVPTLIGVIGITSGPVMGVYLLGFMFPKCNSKGALTGFLAGAALGLWVFIGSTIHQKPPPDLPLSIDACPAELATGALDAANATVTAVFSAAGTGADGWYGMLNSTPTTLDYQSGITQAVNSTTEPDDDVMVLYLVSRWWYPTLTICTVIIVGMATSFVTGFNDPSQMNSDLFVNWYSVFCCCRKPKAESLKSDPMRLDEEEAHSVPLRSIESEQ